MTLGDWAAAQIDPADLDKSAAAPAQPSPSDWHAVEIPGRPDRFAGADAVAYRATFPDPRSSSGERAVLELNGLYAHAWVWMNGEFLGRHDTYFDPFRVPFEPTDENEVVVACRAPTDGFGGVHATDRVAEGEATPSIWWGASVETYPETYLADVEAAARLRDGDDAIIHVRMTVDAAEPVNDRITLSVRPEGFRGSGTMERVPVDIDEPGQVTVEQTLELHDPALWWPQPYGPQHYYRIRATLGDAERTTTTGFRSVSYDDDGLYVNGRRVRARGFNVLSTDDPAGTVERAVAANANLLRTHATVLPSAFYEACDEAGVLVWQDVPLSGQPEYNVDRGTELAAAVADARGHHPSVSLFGVHDDPVDPYENNLGSGRLSKYKLRWQAWRTGYDRSGDEEVAAVLPDDRPVFPVAGQPGVNPDAAHIYPGWAYGKPGHVNWLLDQYPSLGGVVTEFGAGALTDDAVDTDHALLAKHADGDAASSQAYQARVLKTVAERLRRQGSDVIAAYALTDAGDGQMGVLAADGTRKEGYDALAASYEPVQVVLSEYPTRGTYEAVVVNDSTDSLEGTFSWVAGSEDGTEDVTVEPFSRATVSQIRVPRAADTVELGLAFGDETVSNTYHL